MTEMPVQPTPKARVKEPVPPGERRVGWLLGVGIFLLPYVFVWWLLRKGHTQLSRIVGFGWLAVCILMLMFGPKTPVTTDTAGGVQTAASPTSTATPVQTPAEKAERDAERKRVEDARTAEALQRQKQRDLERDPEKFLVLENFSGVKGGFDTVFLLSGTIKNLSDVVIKDPKIECELFGASGTRVGRVSDTLFELVPAEGSKRFREFNLGFMGSDQVSNYNCAIVDAEAILP